jgi:hypothetical protein
MSPAPSGRRSPAARSFRISLPTLSPLARQLLTFAAAFAALFGCLLLLNSPHLGVNAALHWDAEASITWGPAAGSRAELAEARAHLYDVLDHVRGDDPARVTTYYWSEPGLAYHEPLTRCRYYYSWASDLIGHAAFAWGRARFGTPVAAVVCYQLAATALTAAGLAAMAAYAVGTVRATVPAGRARRLAMAMVGLTFAAIGSAPVMLSLARQVLQETPGFAFAAVALLAFMGGVRRARVASIVMLFVSGALAFVAVRCRYTLGPMLGLLLPLAWGLTRGARDASGARPGPTRPGSVVWWMKVAAFALPFAVLLLLDLRRFGPFAWPGVYDAVMVRSSRLFFHADPPYADFIIAAFINLPLLVIPTLGAWCWIADGRGRPAWRAYAVVVLGVLGVMLWRTAAQQVQYQGRHLFAVADGATMLWLLVLPRVRWRPAPAMAYGAVAALFLVWNVCSTFGPQRRASLAKLPDAVAVVTHHLSSEGARDHHSLPRDLWWAYFDWADGRLLHDTLTAWDALHRRPTAPLLVIDAAAADANQMMLYARQFPAFPWVMMHGRSEGAIVDAVRSADRPVFLLTAPGRRPPAGVMDVGPPEPLDLMHVALRPITGVAAAAVELDAGAVSSATSDGLTITRVRGTPRRLDSIYGYLPRAQQEWLSYDGDADRVEYDVTGLRSDRQYRVGFVTWDPDRLGRAMNVSVDGTPLVPAAEVAAHCPINAAPTEVTAPLPRSTTGRARLTFTNAGAGDVVVAEVWVWEVAAR